MELMVSGLVVTHSGGMRGYGGGLLAMMEPIKPNSLQEQKVLFYLFTYFFIFFRRGSTKESYSLSRIGHGGLEPPPSRPSLCLNCVLGIVEGFYFQGYHRAA